MISFNILIGDNSCILYKNVYASGICKKIPDDLASDFFM